ncbi:MAG: transposase [Bryobacteraceae bacterium]|jgi:hypothetical protein
MTKSPEFRRRPRRRRIGLQLRANIPLRDYECVRLGTASLLAGLDPALEIVSDTHKSADFIAFLKKLDETYPPHQKIRLVLDDHSAHISRATRSYLDTAPQRFAFVFKPKHDSWLNLIEKPIQQDSPDHAP